MCWWTASQRCSHVPNAEPGEDRHVLHYHIKARECLSEVVRETSNLDVKLPANTTHLPHPRDQSVKNLFQCTLRNTRAERFMMSHEPWASSVFKIMLAPARHLAPTPKVPRKFFFEAELQPTKYQCLDRFIPNKSIENTPKWRSSNFQTCSESSVRNCRIAKSRCKTRQLLVEIRRLLSGEQSGQSILADIQVLLNDKIQSQ